MAVKKKQDKLAKEPASADFKARIECSLLRGIASSISMLTDEAKLEIDAETINNIEEVLKQEGLNVKLEIKAPEEE